MLAIDIRDAELRISFKLVEPKRIELLTPCLQSRCSTKLSYGPFCQAKLSTF